MGAEYTPRLLITCNTAMHRTHLRTHNVYVKKNEKISL